MAITRDVVGAGTTGTIATSLTSAHTVTNGVTNAVLIAVVGIQGNPAPANITGVTYNGNAMTAMWEAKSTALAFYYCSAWIIALGTGDGTAHNVVATFGMTPVCSGLCTISWKGVDQSSIFRTATKVVNMDTTTGSASVTCANALNNDLVVDGFFQNRTTATTSTAGGNTDSSKLNIVGNGVSLLTTSVLATGSQAMSYTFAVTETIGTLSAAPLIPAAASGPPYTPFLTFSM